MEHRYLENLPLEQAQTLYFTHLNNAGFAPKTERIPVQNAFLAARFYKEYSNGNQKVIHSHFYREMQRYSPIDPNFSNTLADIVNNILCWVDELSCCGINNKFRLALFNINDPMDRMIRGRQYVRHGIFFHLFAHDIIGDYIEKMNMHYHSLRYDTIPSELLFLKLLSKSSRSIFQQFQ